MYMQTIYAPFPMTWLRRRIRATMLYSIHTYKHTPFASNYPTSVELRMTTLSYRYLFDIRAAYLSRSSVRRIACSFNSIESLLATPEGLRPLFGTAELKRTHS